MLGRAGRRASFMGGFRNFLPLAPCPMGTGFNKLLSALTRARRFSLSLGSGVPWINSNNVSGFEPFDPNYNLDMTAKAVMV